MEIVQNGSEIETRGGRGRGRRGRGGRGKGGKGVSMKEAEEKSDTDMQVVVMLQQDEQQEVIENNNNNNNCNNSSSCDDTMNQAPLEVVQVGYQMIIQNSSLTRRERLQERVRVLLTAQSKIQEALHEVKLRHPHRERIINSLDVIQLGNRISTTLHSPRHWKPGALMLSGQPPAPQADHMRKGILGNVKLNLATPNYGDLLKQIQEEIQITAKLSLQKRNTPSLPPPIAPPAMNNEKKRPITEPLPPPDVSTKKQRTININFGFESDSDND